MDAVASAAQHCLFYKPRFWTPGIRFVLSAFLNPTMEERKRPTFVKREMTDIHSFYVIGAKV
jgi:hypothetical protein